MKVTDDLIWIVRLFMRQTNPSICIPLTTLDVNKQLVRSVFNKYKLGPIKQIDIVHSAQRNNKRIFVHFKYWDVQSEKTKQILHRLENGEKINIIYDFPWYWKCHKSKAKKSPFKP